MSLAQTRRERLGRIRTQTRRRRVRPRIVAPFASWGADGAVGVVWISASDGGARVLGGAEDALEKTHERSLIPGGHRAVAKHLRAGRRYAVKHTVPEHVRRLQGFELDVFVRAGGD